MVADSRAGVERVEIEVHTMVNEEPFIIPIAEYFTV
jgi:hypothetical protein